MASGPGQARGRGHFSEIGPWSLKSRTGWLGD
jgi:hypothetical protein